MKTVVWLGALGCQPGLGYLDISTGFGYGRRPCSYHSVHPYVQKHTVIYIYIHIHIHTHTYVYILYRYYVYVYLFLVFSWCFWMVCSCVESYDPNVRCEASAQSCWFDPKEIGGSRSCTHLTSKWAKVPLAMSTRQEHAIFCCEFWVNFW